MKLDAKQVRFRQSMFAGLSRSALTFAARRTSIHLQETAMVLEGELVQFHFFGLERFFARAVSEYSTVTVPYSRLAKVKYDRRWLIRGLMILLAAFFCLITVPAQFTNVRPDDRVGAFVLTGMIWGLIALLTYLALRAVPPTYKVTYRNPDGAKRTFAFVVRKKAVRKRFDAELAKYRDAGEKFAEREE
jgi:hypothetical protein